VIVIDTSALIAIFRLEPEADAFLKAIVRAQARAMSAVTVLETSMVMSGGTAAADAGLFEPLDAFLSEGGVEIAAFDADQSRLAREAFLRFGKGRHKAALNFGDCASYALAKSRAAPLLYKGEDFRRTDVRSALEPGKALR
jgi:ribonuclease VapC